MSDFILCIAGKNNIAVDVLIYLIEKGIDKRYILVIPNKTDDGNDGWQRSLLKKAKELGIRITTLEEVYSIENLVFLSLEFDRIINPRKFKSKNLYNVHFSLLPKYKGMYTSVMPILNNERITGVTLHKIDTGIDTGEIIAQREFEIDFMDNARDLYNKYIYHGTLLTKQYLDKILNKEFIPSKPQNPENSSYFSKKTIDFKNIKIDLNQTAINIHNQIRAFNFREYQIPKVFGTEIISSKILTSRSKKKPGTILLENDICFVISSIDYDVVLYKDRTRDLFLACERNSNDILNRLLQIPKIINTQDEKGITPLMIAVSENNLEIVKSLLMNGADLSICDFEGRNVLFYAEKSFATYKNVEMLKLLLSFDINIYQKDYTGKNVIDYCLENNNFEFLKIIEENNI